MKIRRISFFIILSLTLTIASAQQGRSAIDLAGRWAFAIDGSDVGVTGEWYAKDLPETISLPGSMAQNGKGYDVTVDTKWTGGIVDKTWYTDQKYEKYRRPGNVKVPFWLNPVKVYVGAAWYQKYVDVPRGWEGKHVELFLERCHWETRLWVDNQEIGTNASLSTPHVYDLSRVLTTADIGFRCVLTTESRRSM